MASADERRRDGTFLFVTGKGAPKTLSRTQTVAYIKKTPSAVVIPSLAIVGRSEYILVPIMGHLVNHFNLAESFTRDI